MFKRLIRILALTASLSVVILAISLFARSQLSRAPLPTLARLPRTTQTPIMTQARTPAALTETASRTAAPIATVVVFIPPRHTVSPVPPTLTLAPSLTITTTPSPVILPPLEITFDGVYSLALEFRRPVVSVLAENRGLLPDSRLTVSAYRDIAGWAKITLVPTSLVESRWTDVETVSPVEIIARERAAREWIAYLVGSAAYDSVISEVPQAFVDYVSPVPPAEGEYRFPWQAGHTWWAIQGWHDGNGLDFQPGIGARFAVLAAQAGRLREICSDGYQSLLEIQHADGRSTYYLHVRMGLRTRRQLLDQPVRRGQYLGELIGQQRFVTPCGQGNSRHLHFVVSDRTLVFEGYPLEGVAASASCCANPPSYLSSNARSDASAGSP